MIDFFLSDNNNKRYFGFKDSIDNPISEFIVDYCKSNGLVEVVNCGITVSPDNGMIAPYIRLYHSSKKIQTKLTNNPNHWLNIVFPSIKFNSRIGKLSGFQIYNILIALLKPEYRVNNVVKTF